MFSTKLARVKKPRASRFDTIPDEVLSKILAYVPYFGRTKSGTMTAIRNHDQIRLVSPRFESIMSTKAFKIELLRCQCNDEVQLRAIKSLRTEGQFVKIVLHTARINDFVEALLMRGDGDNMRAMLRTGVRLLDYLNSLNTHSTPRARIMLVQWALDSVLSPPRLQLILRFTLDRILDIWGRPEDFGLIAPRRRLSDLRKIESRSRTGPKAISEMEMGKYRGFETAILLNAERCSLFTALDRRLDEVVMHAVTEHRLIFADRQDLEDGTDIDLFAAEFTSFLNGHQWRFLNPCKSEHVPEDDSSAPSPSISPDNNVHDEETNHGINSFKEVKVFLEQSYTTPDFLDIDFKAVGEFLRYAKNKIGKGDQGVPKTVVEFADEAVRLRTYLLGSFAEDDEE